MSDSHSRPTPISHEVQRVESTESDCSDPLDEFGPESLELFPTEYSERVYHPAGLPESRELIPNQ
jgi:hypothetical protein